MKSKLLKVTTAVALSLAILSSGAVPSFTKQVSAATVKIDGYSYSQDVVDVLRDLNNVRKSMGYGAVTLDPILTQASQGHATYLNFNKLMSHVQLKTKPKFTGEIYLDRIYAIAGKDYNKTLGITDTDEGITASGKTNAVASLLSTPYHRFSMIDPYLKKVGIGIDGDIVVFNYGLDVNLPSPETVVFPYNGQTGVPVSMLAPENPNPLEGTGLTYNTAGYIPTALLPNTADLSSVPVSMTDSKGNAVSVILKKDAEDVVWRSGYSAWLVIPKKPLSYSTTYTVNVNGVKWSFTTKADPSGTGNSGGGGSTPPQQTQPPVSGGTDKIFISKTQQASKTELLAKPLDPTKKFTSSNVGIRINGSYVTLSPSAKVINGSTYIPLRGVFEKLGSKVGWFQPLQEITIEHNDKVVALRIGSTKAYIGSTAVTLSKAPFTENGTTYIPLRFVSEAIGGTVQWDQASNTVTIVAEYNIKQ